MLACRAQHSRPMTCMLAGRQLQEETSSELHGIKSQWLHENDATKRNVLATSVDVASEDLTATLCCH